MDSLQAYEHIWSPVLTALLAELASCAPDRWRSAWLRVSYDEDRMCCLISDGRHGRRAAASPWLISLVHDLRLKMERAGATWNSAQIALDFVEGRARVELTLSPDGECLQLPVAPDPAIARWHPKILPVLRRNPLARRD